LLTRETGSALSSTSEVIEWKSDTRRYPKLKLRGGNYAHSEENLQKTFKQGELIVFLEFGGSHMIKNAKDRKLNVPVFEIVRFLGNGFAMELKPYRLYPEISLSDETLILDETKAYLKGQPRTHSSQLPDQHNSDLTRLTFNTVNS
jgi:hypothetical protein